MVQYIIGGLLAVNVQISRVEIKPAVRTTQAPFFNIENYVREVFGDKANEALKIMWRESRNDPKAKNKDSSASGLFQITKGTWEGNSDYPWEMRFSPKENIETAKRIFDDRGWQPWGY